MADGSQVVHIVAAGGFWPRSVIARAGVPLRVVFHRRDEEACMGRVAFSSPRVERRLAPGAATTIMLLAPPAGEVRFTCAMGRYHGRIRLDGGIRQPLGARLLAAASGLQRRVRSGLAPPLLPIDRLAHALGIPSTRAIRVLRTRARLTTPHHPPEMEEGRP